MYVKKPPLLENLEVLLSFTLITKTNTLGSRYRAGPIMRPPKRNSLSGRTRYRAVLVIGRNSILGQNGA